MFANLLFYLGTVAKTTLINSSLYRNVDKSDKEESIEISRVGPNINKTMIRLFETRTNSLNQEAGSSVTNNH